MLVLLLNPTLDSSTRFERRVGEEYVSEQGPYPLNCDQGPLNVVWRTSNIHHNGNWQMSLAFKCVALLDV